MIDLEAIRERHAEAYDLDMQSGIDRGDLLSYVDALAKDVERLRGELSLIAALQAGDGSTINGPTRDDFGRAFRMAQEIARAAMEQNHAG